MEPETPTDGDSYKRGVEDYRREQGERREVPNRGISPYRSSRRSSSRSPRRRSRSPIRRRSPRRDDRRRNRGDRSIPKKECRVYVSNLSFNTRWMELKDLMKKVAPVEHVEIFTDGEGRSKGCAVVEYSNQDHASQAIKEMDGIEMQGRKLRMREDIMDDITYREQLKTQKDKTKQLKEYQQHMEQQSMSNQYSNFGGLSAIASLTALGGGGGLGSLITQQSAQLASLLSGKNGDPVNSSVFVSNLDYDITWQKLKDMFRRAGNCTRCDIAEGEDRRSKGFGSLQFDTPMEALTAVSMFNGMELGRGKRSMVVRLDRSSILHQILAQLGISSSDITQRTLIQLQSLTTLSALAASGLNLGGLSALTGMNALGSTNNYANLQSVQQSNSSPSSGLNLSNLTGIGSLSTFGGLGNLLGSAGLNSSSMSSGLTGSSIGAGGGYGLSATSNSYGTAGIGSQLSSLGYGGQSERRQSDGGGASRYSASSTSGSSGAKVFVRNLPFSVKWQDLKDKFRDAGRIVRADVMTGEDGRSKGCGLVTFESSSDANRAVSLFNGSRMEGREIEVRIDRY